MWLSLKKAEEIAKKFLRIKEKKQKKYLSDGFLQNRAEELIKKYFQKAVGKFSINWSTRQQKIFGICNHRTRSIKISSRIQKAPSWVVDYLIVHELAHLFEPNHSKKFWQWVNRYPRTERARGFLQGVGFRECSKID